MPVSGTYFDGHSSRPHAAELRVDGGRVGVYAAHGGRMLSGPFARADIQVSSAIGTTPRQVRLPGGGQFETDDHAGLDAELPGKHFWSGFVHRLESRWRYLPLALATVVAVVWWVVAVGVPWSAKTVAFALPPESSQWIAQGALHVLDRHVLAPTTLTAEQQSRLQRRFEAFMAPWQGEQPLRVLFRSGAGSIEANALALPSGTIVFTDELVRLAQHDDELVAVLAHEIGHVRARHSLRQSLQNSALTLALVAVAGDVSALSSVVGSLPLLLTQMGYSRDFEREADDFALHALRAQNVPIRHFENILRRLERSHCAQAQTPGGCEQQDEWSGYWSTHPGTGERIEHLRHAAQ